MAQRRLLSVLVETPELAQLPFDILVTFVDLIRHVKPGLMWNQHSQLTDPPNTLPVSIHCFMRHVLDITDELGKVLWETLKGFAWAEPDDDTNKWLAKRSVALLPLFLRHGPAYGVGFYDFYEVFATMMNWPW
ncbi:hypothetical protein JB92DRAFT_3070512 [Gautieria morchelliformis]|nr:hypothetical protein JB92DRAFT_3070512 [Gautieria morchelliformis]